MYMYLHASVCVYIYIYIYIYTLTKKQLITTEYDQNIHKRLFRMKKIKNVIH